MLYTIESCLVLHYLETEQVTHVWGSDSCVKESCWHARIDLYVYYVNDMRVSRVSQVSVRIESPDPKSMTWGSLWCVIAAFQSSYPFGSYKLLKLIFYPFCICACFAYWLGIKIETISHVENWSRWGPWLFKGRLCREVQRPAFWCHSRWYWPWHWIKKLWSCEEGWHICSHQVWLIFFLLFSSFIIF